MFRFDLLKKDTLSNARLGRFYTSSGVVNTPVFMPVGTMGTVKAMTPHEVKELGAEIILGNTYHLMLRPGHEIVRELGGLHKENGTVPFSCRQEISPDGIFWWNRERGWMGDDSLVFIANVNLY